MNSLGRSTIICAHYALVLNIFLSYALGKEPNIVLIVADDYGYNDVGYHGSELHTPNLDKLANSGVKLENYYVQPICTPSRSQLLSGRYQIHTGLQHYIITVAQPNALPKEIPTLPEVLKTKGYKTHMVGKWHLGFYKKEFTPTHRGFDSYFGYLLGSEDYFKHSLCYQFQEEAPNNYDDIFSPQKPAPDKTSCGLDFHDDEEPARNYTGQYSTHIFSRKAQTVIENHAKKDSESPLFLYLPFQSVHAPLQVPSHYTKPYAHIKSAARRTYAGMVSAMDEAVGNLTETLKSTGMWNNTIILFSTDNGGEVHAGGNNSPLRGWKHSLWEGGVKGVSFLHSPLLSSTGSTYSGLMHISDWFPTIYTLAGGDVANLTLDGFDQWTSMTKGKESPRKELLHNIDPLYPLLGKKLYSNTWDNRVRAALRVGNWKLITGDPSNSSWVPAPRKDEPYPSYITMPESRHKNLWLFDISLDPLETSDVSLKYPTVVKEMLDKLVAYNDTAVPCRYPDSDPRANPDLHGGVWGPWL